MIKKEIYNIEGMSCASCASSIEKIVGKISGVRNVSVNLATEKMFIESEEEVSTEDIEQTIKNAGYFAKLVDNNVSTFSLEGMSCASCARNIENIVGKVSGVQSVSVNLATEKMTVIFDRSKVDTNDIEDAVGRAGFKAIEDKVIKDSTQGARTKKVEQIIRDNNAVPATIAIIEGRIKIGLTEGDLMTLATEKDVSKVSRRDMASIIANQKNGATTVVTPMICASMAGIKFFVTGGIGGVHRGFEEDMDVSADLSLIHI